jgi:hypothetical protein
MSNHQTNSTHNNSNTPNASIPVNGQGTRTVNGEIQCGNTRGQNESRDQPSTAAGSIMRPMSDAERRELGLR